MLRAPLGGLTGECLTCAAICLGARYAVRGTEVGHGGCRSGVEQCVSRVKQHPLFAPGPRPLRCAGQAAPGRAHTVPDMERGRRE